MDWMGALANGKPTSGTSSHPLPLSVPLSEPRVPGDPEWAAQMSIALADRAQAG